MGRLKGKVALVTGAASGMGLATFELFIREGATAVGLDISPGNLMSLIHKSNAAGSSTVFHELDVTDEKSWKSTVEQTVREFGKVDVLINNAGIHHISGILETEMDEWNAVLDVNLTGVWLGMKSVIPEMQRIGGGSIVNTSSIAGIVGGAADANGAAYSASKGAVRSLTKHAAQWFARDQIRVNSIHPGAVFTGITRDGGFASQREMGQYYKKQAPLSPHVGEANDIAYGNLYLASDESKFVTGEELVIDGGWVSH